MPGAAKGYRSLQPVWLDAAQCGLSDFAAVNDKAYSKAAKTWVSNVAGELVGMAGHLHDGGIHADIFINKKKICTSNAAYGGTPAYVSPKMNVSDGMGGMATTHISTMSVCYDKNTPTVGPLKVGDTVDLTGYYDYTKHGGMLTTKGKPSDVMVIAIMFLAQGPIVAESGA
jgi:hypothetical protein